MIFNCILFFSNFMLVGFLPKVLFFGWMPSQFAFSAGSTVRANIVWGLCFNTFFNTQKHIRELYQDK